MDVPHRPNFRRILFTGLLLSLAAGCDRGSHPGQIGTAAPNFTVTDAGRTVRLSDYKGKVVLLNFWTSWCPPCIEEFPYLIALQQKMPQIVVLGVSFDDDDAAYRQSLIDNHVDFLTIRDATQHSNKLYGTTRPPETYIVDRNGVIRRKFIGAQDWTSPEIMDYLSKL